MNAENFGHENKAAASQTPTDGRQHFSHSRPFRRSERSLSELVRSSEATQCSESVLPSMSRQVPRYVCMLYVPGYIHRVYTVRRYQRYSAGVLLGSMYYPERVGPSVVWLCSKREKHIIYWTKPFGTGLIREPTTLYCFQSANPIPYYMGCN